MSKKIKDFGKIRLLAISPYDIIITKLARGDARDFSDIKTIFEKEKIDLNRMASRFIETMRKSFSNNARDNMLLLLRDRLRTWGMKTDEDAIRKVEEWKTT